MRHLITFIMFIATVFAQGGGHGISKSTWGSSEPRKCAAWFKKYLPATETPSTCPDGKCECGTQGRFQLDTAGSGGFNFGIHTINCTYHPYGEHSLEDIEHKIQAEWGDFTKFHPFMDYNVGLWTFDINEYIVRFTKDSINWVGLKWTSDDGKDYYSILVTPCGFSVIELISDTVHEKHANQFKKVDHLRFSFKSKNFKPKESNKYLTPIKISRATARLDEVKKYYTKDIGIESLVNHTGSDGSQTAIFMYDQPAEGVHLHFVQGRQADHELMIQTKDSVEDAFTPKLWEDYMHSVHKAVWKDGVCGFDQWFDNHYAYDGHSHLDRYVENAKKFGLQYHWWTVPSGRYQVYIIDPTGFSAQYDGNATNPPKKVPSYSAACKSDDGCSGQGYCKAKDFFFLQ